MNFFLRRRIRKGLLHGLKEARHIRNLREDVAEPVALRGLDAAIQKTHKVISTLADPWPGSLAELGPFFAKATQGRQAGRPPAGGKSGGLTELGQGWSQAESVATELSARIEALRPRRSCSWLRENLEIMAVALAVAMAFRTYFVQPFKIPTSSMSPTLLGIHYLPQAKPDWVDRTPLRLAKWLVCGSWYVEIRAWASGRVQIVNTPEGRFFEIAGRAHQVFEQMTEHIANGEMVLPGQLLASGARVAGDHIFVNKVAWNFRKPRRGEIMVFKTNGIKHSQIKQNEHYVKRMVGLPGETLSIIPPDLAINGQKLLHPASIARVAAAMQGYQGYQEIGTYLTNQHNRVQLADEEFFACGDNQRNSLDSRYWGPVQRANLVGPAFLVYWPLSRRWGIAD